MMKRTVISLALLLSAAVSTVSAAYIDVPSDAWYGSAVQTATDKKWFGGYEDGSFRPEGTITRAEAMKVLLSYKYGDDVPKAEKSVYADVAADAWYANYVNLNGEKDSEKIIPSKDVFCPEDNITRQDAMYGLVKILGTDMQAADLSKLDAFSDSADIAFNVRQAVAIAVEKGLVSGYDDGTVKPDGSITRAEFAAIMMRADAQAENVSPSPAVSPSPSVSPEPSATPAATPSPTASPSGVQQKDGENLFDYSYTAKTVINAKDGTEKEDSKYITSDYIEVVPGTKYFCATYSPAAQSYLDSCKVYAYYDDRKKFISGGGASLKTPAAAPENAKYIRFSIAKTEDLTGYERLAVYTVFAKSNTAITEFTYPSDAKTTDKFDGKKICFYGDNFIKNGSEWLNVLEKNMGMPVCEAYGTWQFGSATKTSLALKANIDKIPSDADYIIVSGGLYDWLYGRDCGEIGDNDDTKVYGGISLLTKRLRENFKNAEIIYLTPIASETFGSASFTADGRKNALKYTVDDYAQFIRDAAAALGVKVIDANAESGINFENIDQYMNKAGNYKWYPNEEGGKLYGEYLLKKLCE